MVTLDRPFQVLVANLGKTPQRVTKHKVIGSVIVHPLAGLPKWVTAVEILGSTTQDVENSTVDVLADDRPALNRTPEVAFVTTAEKDEHLESENSMQNQSKDLDELGLSHVPSYHKDRLLQLLLEFITVWDR